MDHNEVFLIGYLSPGTWYIQGDTLNDALNIVFKRVVVIDKDGHGNEAPNGYIPDAPLMQEFLEHDGVISLGKIRADVGLTEEDTRFYLINASREDSSDAIDFPDTPAAKESEKLHADIVALMTKEGISTCDIRHEDDQTAIVFAAMMTSGHRSNHDALAALAKGLSKLLKGKTLKAQMFAMGASTIHLQTDNGWLSLRYPTFAV
ncbi:hypothetical protein D3C79_854340 [compost metagenome]